jgi:hypothetical protein
MADSVADRSPRALSIVRHPLYSVLLPVPVVCFLGMLLTNVTYLGSGGNAADVGNAVWRVSYAGAGHG